MNRAREFRRINSIRREEGREREIKLGWLNKEGKKEGKKKGIFRNITLHDNEHNSNLNTFHVGRVRVPVPVSFPLFLSPI